MDEILVVGSGALGTLFAARLAEAGAGVALLGSWPEGLDALRDGARWVDSAGTLHTAQVRVARNAGECGRPRHALVLVKSWQTESSARALARCLAGDGLAVTLQNGLGNREILAQGCGAERVAQGVTTTGAALIEPGIARLGGEGTLAIEQHPRLAPLAGWLRRAGFDLQVTADVRSLAWGKLVVNCAINPLTALLDLPNGGLLDCPPARRLMAELAQETAGVATGLGIGLPFGDPVEAAEAVARRTARNVSSMLQDVRRGAPTEIESICGAVVRAAQEAGLAAPANRLVLELVRARAASVRPASPSLPGMVR